MRISNVTERDLHWALDMANRFYDGNISFKMLECMTKHRRTWHVGLRAVDCRGPGGRLGYRGRRIGNCACWHVHRDFFQALYDMAGSYLCKAPVIRTALGTYRHAGDWIDKGGLSGLCQCEED